MALLHQVTVWNLLHIDGLTNVYLAEVWHESLRLCYNLTPAERGWICERGGSPPLKRLDSSVTLFRHWFVSAWGAFLPYIFLNVEETRSDVSQETLKGLYRCAGVKGQAWMCWTQPGRRPVFVCDTSSLAAAMATEHFAHVRIIVKSWKRWSNTRRSLEMMSEWILYLSFFFV